MCEHNQFNIPAECVSTTNIILQQNIQHNKCNTTAEYSEQQM